MALSKGSVPYDDHSSQTNLAPEILEVEFKNKLPLSNHRNSDN